jgi:predicted HicB family RNase H-like nuclease
MPSQSKPKKVGRPKLPKVTKGQIVPVRFSAEDLKRITAAAKANKQTVSEWVRGAISAAIQA